MVGCGCFLGRPQNLGSLGFGAPPGGEVRLGLGLLGFCARADWSPPPPGRWEHSALGLRPRGFMGKLCYEQGCPPLLGEARQANGSGLWLFRLGGLFHGCPPLLGRGFHPGPSALGGMGKLRTGPPALGCIGTPPLWAFGPRSHHFLWSWLKIPPPEGWEEIGLWALGPGGCNGKLRIVLGMPCFLGLAATPPPRERGAHTLGRRPGPQCFLGQAENLPPFGREEVDKVEGLRPLAWP